MRFMTKLTIEGSKFCGSIVPEAFIVSYIHQRNGMERWRVRPGAKPAQGGFHGEVS